MKSMINLILRYSLLIKAGCQSEQDHEENTLALMFSVFTDLSLCHKV